jgi:deferrochelatase/peroxidase EfeB
MPEFPGDNLDRRRCHGDVLVLVQSDHAMVTHHALRAVMRRTKGRLEGRWAQSCYLAVRLIRLKLERWDRLSRTAQEDSIGARRCRARRSAASARRRCRRSTSGRRSTPTSGWPTRAGPATSGFFCPPGVEGEGDYLARRLVEPA